MKQEMFLDLCNSAQLHSQQLEQTPSCQGHEKRTVSLRNCSTSRRNVPGQSAACIPLWSRRPGEMRKMSFMGSGIWKKAQSLGLPAAVRWTPCSSSCEVNRRQQLHQVPARSCLSSESNRSLCAALPQQLALLCSCSGSFYPLQH